MCDYSLHNVASRPASVGDKLVTQSFATTCTRGFAAVDEPDIAVCVLPGTELAFEKDVEWYKAFLLFRRKQPSGKLVRFRQLNMENPHTHHDAIEFPNGKTIRLTMLCEGQRATVLQLPATSQPARSAAVPEAAANSPAMDRVAAHRDVPFGL